MSYALVCFFFNDTAPPEIYPLSLHDPLPIPRHAVPDGVPLEAGRRHAGRHRPPREGDPAPGPAVVGRDRRSGAGLRSEEHTSELQSRQYLVCRLLLEKKKHQNNTAEQIETAT